jgi:hypothetical protein
MSSSGCKIGNKNDTSRQGRDDPNNGSAERGNDDTSNWEIPVAARVRAFLQWSPVNKRCRAETATAAACPVVLLMMRTTAPASAAGVTAADFYHHLLLSACVLVDQSARKPKKSE